MEDDFFYTCEYKYCKKKYEPKKRGIQKFCSRTCKNKHWYSLNKSSSPIPVVNSTDNDKLVDKQKKKKKKAPKPKRMSIAGVGDSTAGNLLATEIRNFLTKEENKPATKGDLMKIINYFEHNQKIIIDELKSINKKIPQDDYI